MDNSSENGSRLNRSRIIPLLLSGLSVSLLAITGITLKHPSIEKFLVDGEWPSYLLVTVLLLTPWILWKSSRSTVLSIIFFITLYLLFELNFLHDGSKLFWGDSAIFHISSFWYFGNSIALESVF